MSAEEKQINRDEKLEKKLPKIVNDDGYITITYGTEDNFFSYTYLIIMIAKIDYEYEEHKINNNYVKKPIYLCWHDVRTDYSCTFKNKPHSDCYKYYYHKSDICLSCGGLNSSTTPKIGIESGFIHKATCICYSSFKKSLDFRSKYEITKVTGGWKLSKSKLEILISTYWEIFGSDMWTTSILGSLCMDKPSNNIFRIFNKKETELVNKKIDDTKNHFDCYSHLCIDCFTTNKVNMISCGTINTKYMCLGEAISTILDNVST